VKGIMRIIILLLVMVLFMNSIVFSSETSLEEAIPDINTDGSQSCAVWFRVFDNLLNEKVTNGVKFFYILSALRHDSVESNISTVLDRDSTRKSLLGKYGLGTDSIYFLMNYFMSTFPENIDDIEYNYSFGENIYADLFHDRNFDYSKYMVRFHNYLNELFRQLPHEMQSIITKYDRKQAGEIIVMQGLMNIVISDYIAFETYNTLSNTSMSRTLGLRDDIRQSLINELVRVAIDYPEDYSGDQSVDMDEIVEYVDVFMGLGNVMLESVEMSLNENDLMKYAIELSRDSNLLVRTPYTPTPEQTLIEITLRMNTEFIELDSSNPLTEGYYNEFLLIPTVGGLSRSVIYTIDDPSVAKVDEDGLVTLSSSKQGTAKITATVKGYDVYKEIIVQVTEESPKGAIQFYGPYISGYPDNSFKAEKDITRAEIATMMVRVLRLDTDEFGFSIKNEEFEIPTYKDVDVDHWAYKYVEIAKQYNLLGGYGDNTFKPDAPVTRAEIAVVISNVWDIMEIEHSELAKHFIKDVSVDHWAFDAINKAYNAKVVSGYEDGTFKPDDYTTRGQIVVMINKIINRESLEPETPSFIDVLVDHWAYGFVESATKIQVIKEKLEESN